MTRDEAITLVLESLVDDGIFIRTGEYDGEGNPVYTLAPELKELGEVALLSLTTRRGSS